MIVPFLIVYLLAHQGHPERWAVETWAWICHHVLLTVVLLLIGV